MTSSPETRRGRRDGADRHLDRDGRRLGPVRRSGGSTPIPTPWPGPPNAPGSPRRVARGVRGRVRRSSSSAPRSPRWPTWWPRSLRLAPDAIVTDVGSVKTRVMTGVEAGADPGHLDRYVGGHPMGGAERSGPEHASASVLDGVVWVLSPAPAVPEATVRPPGERGWSRLGARPVPMHPERHDRLVAIVSHLPQVASTALMSLAASEEADEPEILLLAAGGFRDLTRLAASTRASGATSCSRTATRSSGRSTCTSAASRALRALIDAADADEVERAFGEAKQARLSLAAKPQVKAGVAVLQVQVPDRPGALAEVTATIARRRREHRGPADRALARRGPGDRAPHGGRRRRRGTPSAPCASAGSSPSGWREAGARDRPARVRSTAETTSVPGDKSIAHRWLILAATAHGPQRAARAPRCPRREGDGELSGRDRARRMLDLHSRVGLRIPAPRQTVTVPRRTTPRPRAPDLVLEGHGRASLHPADDPLDCANSGTTMRLLAGVLASAPVPDRAPRGREPQRPADGAGRRPAAGDGRRRANDGRPPADRGPRAAGSAGSSTGRRSRARRSRAPSCSPVSPRRVRRPSASRPRPVTTPNERWRRSAPRSRSSPGWRPSGRSSTRGSRRRCPATSRRPRSCSGRPPSRARPSTIEGVGLNPTRTRFLEVLGTHGCSVGSRIEREELGEPVGTLEVEPGAGGSSATTIDADELPLVIDEVPVLGDRSPRTRTARRGSGAAPSSGSRRATGWAGSRRRSGRSGERRSSRATT